MDNKKPLIGISARHQNTEDYFLHATYVNAIRNAGGIPILIPADPSGFSERYAAILDGYLIPGGIDVTPLLYGEQPHANVKWTYRDIDMAEIAVARTMMEQKKPLLGICRGNQLLNVMLGGTLYQDLPTQTKNEICHYQDLSNRTERTHSISIRKGSLLHSILETEETLVNTFHHQAIRTLGEGLEVAATAPDGTIESVESADGLIQGIQWHPEELAPVCEEAQKIFAAFVERCRVAAEQK